jgi:PEP-CTERM motif
MRASVHFGAAVLGVVGYFFAGGIAPSAQAEIIVQYDFNTDFSPTTLAPNVVASPASGAPSVPMFAIVSTGGNTYAQLMPFPGATTGATAVSTNSYFQFTVGPAAGFGLDLTTLEFDSSRGGAATPRGWVIRSSLDGFASNLAGPTDVPTADPIFTHYSIDLSGSAFQDLTSPLTFRIYSYVVDPSFQVMEYDNLTVNGAVATAAVPEPSSLALLVVGGVGLVGWRRWKQATS